MKKLIILSIICVLGFSSCDDWLEVKPELQIESDDLFSEENGFKDAVLGVYISCASPELYAGNLSYSLVDILGGYHKLGEKTDYGEMQKYNYNDNFTKSKIESTWNNAYKTISYVNVILRELDKPGAVKITTYNLIKGEMLAMRAFLHFDMLRLFAPNIKDNPTYLSIPYVTEFTNSVTKQSTVEEAMKLIIADMEEGRRLLAENNSDPILGDDYKKVLRAGGESTAADYSSFFLKYRIDRMNYYATTGLLARMYLYRGGEEDSNKAYTYANEVINSGMFNFVDVEADVAVGTSAFRKDRLFSDEVIFSWYVKDLSDYHKKHFRNAADSEEIFKVDEDELNEIYQKSSGGVDDVRLNYLFETDRTTLLSSKYWIPESNIYAPRIPELRLSEMYYIAAECKADEDITAAVKLLTTIIKKRNVSKVVRENKKDLLDELLKEYRKEFYGEGEFFFTSKRLNVNIPGETMTNAKWVLPFPDSEIEFGNRITE